MMTMSKNLFVWYYPFGKLLNGGGQANKNILSIAQSVLGADNIHSFYINEVNYSQSIKARIIGNVFLPLGYFNGLTPTVLKKLIAQAQQYDSIFLSSSLMGIIARRLRESGYKGKIITMFHNVEEEYFKHLLPSYRLDRIIKIDSAKKNDAWSCKYADTVITFNERDSKLLAEKYYRSADAIIPISLADTFRGVSNGDLTRQRPLCTFIGSNFKANVDGLLWFVENVLPKVNIDFRVVGMGMKELQEQHACLQSLEVVSDVPNLAPYYNETDFIVAPIFTGSGMKVKTCEALMYGKNILATDESFEGYEIDTDLVGKRCNDAQSFVDAINNYSKHPVLRFNEYSRKMFLEKYSLAVASETFRDVIFH